jgi:hypothetical protein
MYITGG